MLQASFDLVNERSPLDCAAGQMQDVEAIHARLLFGYPT
jgi:hypothetical protein